MPAQEAYGFPPNDVSQARRARRAFSSFSVYRAKGRICNEIHEGEKAHQKRERERETSRLFGVGFQKLASVVDAAQRIDRVLSLSPSLFWLDVGLCYREFHTRLTCKYTNSYSTYTHHEQIIDVRIDHKIS